MDREGRIFMNKLGFSNRIGFADIYNAKGYKALSSECPMYYADNTYFHIINLRKQNLLDYNPKMNVLDRLFESSHINNEKDTNERPIESLFSLYEVQNKSEPSHNTSKDEHDISPVLSSPITESIYSSRTDNNSDSDDLSENYCHNGSELYDTNVEKDVVPVTQYFIKSIIKKLHAWYNSVSTLKNDIGEYPGTNDAIILRNKAPRLNPVKMFLMERWGDDNRQIYNIVDNRPIVQENLKSVESLCNMFITEFLVYIDKNMSKNLLFRKSKYWTHCCENVKELLVAVTRSESLRDYVYKLLGIAIESQFRMIESNVIKELYDVHRYCNIGENALSRVIRVGDPFALHRSATGALGCDIKILTLETLILTLIYNNGRARIRDKKYSNMFSRMSDTNCKFTNSHSGSKTVCKSRRVLAGLLTSPKTEPKNDTNTEMNSLSYKTSVGCKYVYPQNNALGDLPGFTLDCYVKQKDEERRPLVKPTSTNKSFKLRRRNPIIRGSKKGYDRLRITYVKIMQRIEKLYRRIKQKTSKIKHTTIKKLTKSMYSEGSVNNRNIKDYRFDNVNSWSGHFNYPTNVMRTCSPVSANLMKNEPCYQMNNNDFFELIALPESPNTGVVSDILNSVSALNDSNADDDEDIIVIEGPNDTVNILNPELHNDPGHRIEIISVSNARKDHSYSKVYRKMEESGIFEPKRDRKSIFERACPKFMRKTKKEWTPLKLKVRVNNQCKYDDTSFDGTSNRQYDSVCSEYYGISDRDTEISHLKGVGVKQRKNQVYPHIYTPNHECNTVPYRYRPDRKGSFYSDRYYTNRSTDIPLQSYKNMSTQNCHTNVNMDRNKPTSLPNVPLYTTHNHSDELTREYHKLCRSTPPLNSKLDSRPMEIHSQSVNCSTRNSQLTPRSCNKASPLTEPRKIVNLYRGRSYSRSLPFYDYAYKYNSHNSFNSNLNINKLKKQRLSESGISYAPSDLKIETPLDVSNPIKKNGNRSAKDEYNDFTIKYRNSVREYGNETKLNGYRNSYTRGSTVTNRSVVNPVLHIISSGTPASSLLSDIFIAQGTSSKT